MLLCHVTMHVTSFGPSYKINTIVDCFITLGVMYALKEVWGEGEETSIYH